MKIATRPLLVMVVLAALTATVWAQNASKSAIIGSAHDLTNDSWEAPSATTGSSVSTNLCFFCHITHKTGTSLTSPGYMLWNHTLSTQGSYGTYSSDTFNALLAKGGSTITDLGSNFTSSPTVSNLCLSCHDGTTAIASFYQTGFNLPATGSSIVSKYGAFSTISGGNPFYISDLSRSHPVNFNYTPALASAAGGGLLSPGSYSVHGGGALPLYGGTGLMECSTCHDPHNGTGFVKVATTGSTTGATTTVFPFPRLLLETQATTNESAVCTYCHT